MTAQIDMMDPEHPKHVLMIVANPGTNPNTGWPVGFWWSELTHPWWTFAENGYRVTIASPNGGPVEADSFSDPRHESGYSAEDFLSLGFLSSPQHSQLLDNTPSLDSVELDDVDAVFVVGGQAPMVNMVDDKRLHRCLTQAYESGKVVAAVCHGTCALLNTRLADGSLLVEGKTWTGFANSEEQFADDIVGQRVQPFWIEDRARDLEGTQFIVQGAFRPHAVRDGRLITGQQQYSGTAAAELVVQALGV